MPIPLIRSVVITNLILNSVKNSKNKHEIAVAYAFGIASDVDGVDWKAINGSIRKYYSRSGFLDIKEQAWHIVEEASHKED